jgi:hypothetical protein
MQNVNSKLPEVLGIIFAKSTFHKSVTG